MELDLQPCDVVKVSWSLRVLAGPWPGLIRVKSGGRCCCPKRPGFVSFTARGKQVRLNRSRPASVPRGLPAAWLLHAHPGRPAIGHNSSWRDAQIDCAGARGTALRCAILSPWSVALHPGGRKAGGTGANLGSVATELRLHSGCGSVRLEYNGSLPPPLQCPGLASRTTSDFRSLFQRPAVGALQPQPPAAARALERDAASSSPTSAPRCGGREVS